MKKQQSQIEDSASKIFLLSKENLRLKLRVRTLKEKVMESSKRGSIDAVCHHLRNAAKEGLLNDEVVLSDLLETTGRNFHVKGPNGKRYKAGLQQFYEVIMYWGGPRLESLIAINLFGPEVHSIYRWRNKGKVNFVPGLSEENFLTVQRIYSEAMQRPGMAKGPVEISEDETGIIKAVKYFDETDMCVGFCGKKDAENHECLDNLEIPVGDGEEGYKKIINAFQNNDIGSYGRAILINPLNKSLPKLPILIMTTCNKFDSAMVKEQWDTINKLYEVHLEPIIGPLIGESSDGDSRRRKLFIEHMTSESKLKFQPIAKDLDFILTAEKVIGESGYRIRNLSDSDFIHNHKKLINHLDHNSRSLRMGPYLVHLNHIRNVFNVFDFHQHGITREDINRADKQNWRSAQRLTFPKVRDCLDMVMKGENGVHQDTSVLGTKVYLLLTWMYVEIFCSKIATLERRIVYASTICSFLGIWHNWITLEKTLTTKANFLSRETYLDILISCHFAVSVICYMRDEHPEIKCNLDETGTGCVESFLNLQMGNGWVITIITLLEI